MEYLLFSRINAYFRSKIIDDNLTASKLPQCEHCHVEYHRVSYVNGIAEIVLFIWREA